VSGTPSESKGSARRHPAPEVQAMHRMASSDRQRLTRRQFERWIDTLVAGTDVIMESCGTSHYWGFRMQARGLRVRLLPVQYVRANFMFSVETVSAVWFTSTFWRLDQYLHPTRSTPWLAYVRTPTSRPASLPRGRDSVIGIGSGAVTCGGDFGPRASAWSSSPSARQMRTPIAERFVRSIKEECLDRLIPIGEQHVRRALAEYVEHYHGEWNHRGLGNRLITGPPVIDRMSCVLRHSRLGGLLNFYERVA
jgi:hypothetical protein